MWQNSFIFEYLKPCRIYICVELILKENNAVIAKKNDSVSIIQPVNMKHCLLIFAFIILSNSYIRAQESEKKVNFSPEILLSVNRTAVADGNMHDKFGFSAGIYHPMFYLNPKRNHFIIGLEYNRNRLFAEFISTNNKWGGGNHNTTYTINNISFPVFYRVNMGKKVLFFLEAGAFGDIAIRGRKKGRYKVVINDNVNQTTTTVDRLFDDEAMYKNNFGIQGGAGLRIPVQKHEILLKGDYKWGMRNIYKNDYYDIIQNRYWRFSIGFKANRPKN